MRLKILAAMVAGMFVAMAAPAQVAAPDPANTLLLDLSVEPPLKLSNQTVTFTIGAASCDAMTDADGVASCSVALGAPAVTTLVGSFAGTTALLPATDRVAFHVLDDRIFANGFDPN